MITTQQATNLAQQIANGIGQTVTRDGVENLIRQVPDEYRDQARRILNPVIGQVLRREHYNRATTELNRITQGNPDFSSVTFGNTPQEAAPQGNALNTWLDQQVGQRTSQAMLDELDRRMRQAGYSADQVRNAITAARDFGRTTVIEAHVEQIKRRIGLPAENQAAQQADIGTWLDSKVGATPTQELVNEFRQRARTANYGEDAIQRAAQEAMRDGTAAVTQARVNAVKTALGVDAQPTQQANPVQTQEGTADTLFTWLDSQVGVTGSYNVLTELERRARDEGYTAEQVREASRIARANGGVPITQNEINQVKACFPQAGQTTAPEQVDATDVGRQAREFLNARLNKRVTDRDLRDFQTLLNGSQLLTEDDVRTISNRARDAAINNGTTVTEYMRDTVIGYVTEAVDRNRPRPGTAGGLIPEAQATSPDVAAAQAAVDATQAAVDAAPDGVKQSVEYRALERQLATTKKALFDLQVAAREKVAAYNNQGTFCDDVWNWASDAGLGTKDQVPKNWIEDHGYKSRDLKVSFDYPMNSATPDSMVEQIEKALQSALPAALNSIYGNASRRVQQYIGQKVDATSIKVEVVEVSLEEAEARRKRVSEASTANNVIGGTDLTPVMNWMENQRGGRGNSRTLDDFRTQLNAVGIGYRTIDQLVVFAQDRINGNEISGRAITDVQDAIRRGVRGERIGHGSDYR